MALDVTVKISETAVAGKIGFGIPLVLVSKGEKAIPYTECAKLEEVANLYNVESNAYKVAKLIWTQTNAPEKIAFYTSESDAEAAIAEVISKDWRQLIVIIGSGDTTTIADIAEYIETTEKMYFVTVSSTSELATIKGKERTVAFYYDIKNEDTLVEPYAVAAVVGEAAGREVGSYTYKNLIIKDLDPCVLSDNEVNEIHNGGGITLLLKAGDIVTSEGITTSGEYIDVIDSKDWIIQQIGYQSQQLLNSAAKLPYTNAGIAALENVTNNVLQQAFNNGMIATDEDGVTALYSVDFKKRSDMSAEDRKSRIYTGGNFEFTLAGAIHNVTINGELVI